MDSIELGKDVAAKAYIDGCFLDYKTARDEVISVSARFYATVQYGMATCIGFIVAAFGFWEKDVRITLLILTVLIPTLAFWFMQMLLAQIELIWRAGKYCGLIEEKLAILVGRNFISQFQMEHSIFEFQSLKQSTLYPVGWERWLRGEDEEKDKHSGTMFRLSTGLFALISIVSLTLFLVFAIARYSDIFDSNYLTAKIDCGGKLKSGLLAIILFSIEATKAKIAFRQAVSIVHPLSIYPPLWSKSKTTMQSDNPSSDLIHSSLKTVTVSALVAVALQMGAIASSLYWKGAVLFVLTILGATLSSALRRRNSSDQAQGQEPRTWKNAIANAGVATAIASLIYFSESPNIKIILLASFTSTLGAGLADTISHEVGVMWGGRPFLLVPFRQVEPGTNGAVSFIGSLAGFLTVVLFTGVGSYLFGFSLLTSLVIIASQILGNVTDTLLGATLEKKGIIGNNSVNFLCTFVAALTSLFAVWCLGR